MCGKIDPESTELYQAINLVVDILESQPSLPSNLDEAALKELQVYLPQGNGPDGICYFIAPQMLAMYKAGAEGMAGQFEKNRLAACDAQTKEDYEMETAFVDKIIREQHRTPTFSDAINFGIEWQKKQK